MPVLASSARAGDATRLTALASKRDRTFMGALQKGRRPMNRRFVVLFRRDLG
jgi:hypothetical protein